jgi:rhamnulokinase
MSLKIFNCLAVDMGAGSIRVMYSSIREGRITLEEVHRFPNEIYRVDGHDRWDMEGIIRGIREGIAKAVRVSGNRIDSIGVDSWGVDFVLMDGSGSTVEQPVAYRDQRTEGMRELWNSRMSEQETFRRTGINFYRFNTLFQLLSLKGSQELEQTAGILFIPGYINFLLSGVAVNELTIASTSQMLGVKGFSWDAAILGELGLDEGLLGQVDEPGRRLGPVILPEAGSTGMELVSVCGHDTACVVAAIPAEHPGFAYISAGTWCIVGIESTEPLLERKALETGFTNERGYGDTYRVLKNLTGLWLVQGLKAQLKGDPSYAELERMTGQGPEAVQVIDPDDPVFYNPPDMKQAFDAYFRKTGQAIPPVFSNYLRCAYDSICFSFRYHIELLEQLSGRSIEILHVVGGGSQSDYLNQHIATICGRQVLSGPVEGAALGNILVQAVALGKVGGQAAGRRLIGESFPVRCYRPHRLTEAVSRRYELFIRMKENSSQNISK